MADSLCVRVTSGKHAQKEFPVKASIERWWNNDVSTSRQSDFQEYVSISCELRHRYFQSRDVNAESPVVFNLCGNTSRYLNNIYNVRSHWLNDTMVQYDHNKTSCDTSITFGMTTGHKRNKPTNLRGTS